MSFPTEARAWIALLALGGVPVWAARVACTLLETDLHPMHWVTAVTAGLVACAYSFFRPQQSTTLRALLLPLGVWVAAPLGASVSCAIQGGEPAIALTGLASTPLFPVRAPFWSVLDGSFSVLLIAPGVMCGALGTHVASRALLSRLAARRASALLGRAQAAYRSEDYAGALGLLEEAIEALPTFAPTWRQRAWILATCEDPALRDVQHAWSHGAHDGSCFAPSPSFPLPVLGMHSEQRYLEGLEVGAAVLARRGEFSEAVHDEKTAIDVARRAGIAGAEMMVMGRRLAAYERGEAWTESDPRSAPIASRRETATALTQDPQNPS